MNICCTNVTIKDIFTLINHTFLFLLSDTATYDHMKNGFPTQVPCSTHHTSTAFVLTTSLLTVIASRNSFYGCLTLLTGMGVITAMDSNTSAPVIYVENWKGRYCTKHCCSNKNRRRRQRLCRTRCKRYCMKMCKGDNAAGCCCKEKGTFPIIGSGASAKQFFHTVAFAVAFTFVAPGLKYLIKCISTPLTHSTLLPPRDVTWDDKINKLAHFKITFFKNICTLLINYYFIIKDSFISSRRWSYVLYSVYYKVRWIQMWWCAWAVTLKSANAILL